jgi:hypothetical protein
MGFRGFRVGFRVFRVGFRDVPGRVPGEVPGVPGRFRVFRVGFRLLQTPAIKALYLLLNNTVDSAVVLFIVLVANLL